ncbi:MAG: ABC transporter substrate-binding protein [bacterium]
MKKNLLIVLLASISLLSCSDQKSENTLTIYTSLYPEVIAIMKQAAARELPDLKLDFLQLGSELVAARVNTELAAGGAKADIIMTSDPFWYHELKKAGLLEQIDAPQAGQAPPSLRDPDNYWITNRIPVMVIAYNKNSAVPAPTGLADLTDPEYRGKITMGDPLKSGTNFTTIAVLARTYGWEFIEKLKANEIMSSGGNSATLRRVESMEYPIGVVLLENLLATRRKNTDVEIIYPEDLLISIPSPIAIMKGTKNLQAAKRFCDFAFSKAGQEAIIAGYMYSPLPGFAPPAGARPWQEVAASMFEWDDTTIDEIGRTREEIKKRFREIMQKD